MRLKLSIFLVLAMSWAAMALERLPRPEDASSAEQWAELFKALTFLAFFSPIGWGVAILLVISFCIWLGKGAKTLVTADYRRIPEDEKRDRHLQEMGKE